MAVGDVQTYAFPSALDINTDDVLTFSVTYTNVVGSGNFNDFLEVDFDADKMMLSPDCDEQQGTYKIMLTITDNDSANSGSTQSADMYF
jgi:hypothetical protein